MIMTDTPERTFDIDGSDDHGAGTAISTTQTVTVVPAEALRKVHMAIERSDADFSQLYAAMEWQLMESENAQWAETADKMADFDSGDLLTNQIFGVTSAVPGEGKTTVAMHLAFSMARNTGKKVCLMDLSMGNNEVCSRLGVRTEKGLIDVLEGRDYVIRTLQLSDCGDLAVMPGGKSPRNANNAARSPAIAELMAAAREIYDVVVVDLPAVSGGNALPIAVHLDKVVLVVCAGVTPKDVVQQSIDRIGKKRVLGVVLNRIQSAAPNWFQKKFFRVAR
jgi:Mrp family chromosome partitioning ATPase